MQKKETGKEMWAKPQTNLNESLLYIEFIYVFIILLIRKNVNEYGGVKCTSYVAHEAL